jgi:hypothetical protein
MTIDYFQAFIFNKAKQTCSLGAVDVKRERIIPDYLINKTEVFVRDDLVGFRSMRNIPRFHQLAPESQHYIHDAPIEVTGRGAKHL